MVFSQRAVDQRRDSFDYPGARATLAKLARKRDSRLAPTKPATVAAGFQYIAERDKNLASTSAISSAL